MRLNGLKEMIPTEVIEQSKLKVIIEPIKNCIKCNFQNINQIGKVSTLVAFTKKDMNHIWTSFRCGDCQHVFEVENSGDNYWISEKITDRQLKLFYSKRVLLGIPNCCEEICILPCKCGKFLSKTHYTSVSVEKKYGWYCSKCGFFFAPPEKEVFIENKDIEFTSELEIGIGVGNLKSIKTLELYTNEDDNLGPIN